MDARALRIAAACLASLLAITHALAQPAESENNREPRVRLIEPKRDAELSAPANIVLQAQARDRDHNLARVEFHANGALVGTSTAEPYSLNWGPLWAGEYVLIARAIDALGAIDETRPVTIRVAGNHAPAVALTSPANGTLFTAPGPITLTANAADADGNLARVDFYSGDTLIGTAVALPYTITWSDNAPGPHSLTAQAVDSQGAAVRSAPVAIVVNAVPMASLTSPSQNAVFTAPASVPITADVSDNDGTISSVEFYFGTTLIATRTAPPYAIVWTAVPQGAYSLTAKAIDNSGGIISSTAIAVTVKSAEAKLYFIHVDHLNTPRLVADEQQRTVWRWDQQEPFGGSVPDENPVGLGLFEFPGRFPGQYFDAETNLHYNYYRDYNPTLGNYLQSDPIGLRGGGLNTYTYANGNPLALIDPKGLEVQVGVRKFYPVGLPLVRHCFVRFNGNNLNTLSFTPSGVGTDGNPSAAVYSPTIGPENDSCVREQMLKCRDYAFFTNNCCDCVAYALNACGLQKAGPWPNFIPAGPFRQAPPSMCDSVQGCPFP